MVLGLKVLSLSAVTLNIEAVTVPTRVKVVSQARTAVSIVGMILDEIIQTTKQWGAAVQGKPYDFLLYQGFHGLEIDP